MTRVAILGGGVIGLTSAVVLQRKLPSVHVTLITEKLSPETTGDGSAGYWEPYLLEDTPSEDILRWAGRTYNFFLNLWKSSYAGKAGISLIPVVQVTDVHEPLPSWKDTVLECSALSEKELNEMNSRHGKTYKSGFRFISLTCEPTKFLPMMLDEFKSRGGILEQRYVSSLSELVGMYDILINCSGLQARFVVPDSNVHPIRGQVMRAKAPWVFHCFMDNSENGCYIIPNQETIVLGGTKQHDWNLQVDKTDAKNIISKCSQIIPSLSEAEIAAHWVGLRPGRNRVRVERETMRTPNGQTLEIVHNYGHGGAGITLSWGCAEDVVNIVTKILQDKMPASKL